MTSVAIAPCGMPGEELHGNLRSPGARGYPGKLQSHFHTGERADHGKVIEVAEMADTEDAVGDLRQSAAKRHIKTVENDLAQVVGDKIGIVE